MKIMASGSPLRDSPPHDEKQGGGDDDSSRNVADARINGRRNRRWQAGIQHAFDAETEPCDKPSHGINDRGDAGVRGTNHRQALLDRAQPRLLQMLVGAGRDSKPAVIGQIDDPARTVFARCNVAGKDCFITNQG